MNSKFREYLRREVSKIQKQKYERERRMDFTIDPERFKIEEESVQAIRVIKVTKLRRTDKVELKNGTNHGSESAYRNYSCRCAPCRSAASEARTRRRENRRSESVQHCQ